MGVYANTVKTIAQKTQRLLILVSSLSSCGRAAAGAVPSISASVRFEAVRFRFPGSASARGAGRSCSSTAQAMNSTVPTPVTVANGSIQCRPFSEKSSRCQ
eukprot:1137460-Prymnesium_polylepis.2